MAMTWKDGWDEIDSFYEDSDKVSRDSVHAKDDVRAGNKVTVGNASEVEVEDASKDMLGTQLSPNTDLSTKKAAPSSSSAEEEIVQSPKNAVHELKLFAPAAPEAKDHMEVDHVRPSKLDDATEPATSERTHYTDQVSRDTVNKTTTDTGDTGLSTSTRPCGASMHVPLSLNKTDQQQAEEPGADSLQELPVKQRDSTSPSATEPTETVSEKGASPRISTTDSPLPVRPSPAKSNKTPGQQARPLNIMTPRQPPSELQPPPSSDGKSSLIDEMREEDEHSFPNPRQSSIKVASDGAGARDCDTDDTDDEDSFHDAPSSPTTFQERLQEAADDQDEETEGAQDIEIGYADAEGAEDEIEVSRVGEHEGGLVDRSNHSTLPVIGSAIEAAEAVNEEVAAQRDDEITVTNIRKDSGTAVRSEDYAAPNADEAKESEDVTMEDVKVAKAAPKKKQPARSRAKTATKPQTRPRRGKAAAAEQPTKSSVTEGSAIEVPIKDEKLSSGAETRATKAKEQVNDETASTVRDEMSEDELATTSPSTIPQKRKASIADRTTTATDGRPAKKSKAAAVKTAESISTDTAVKQEQAIDTLTTAGGITDALHDDTTTSPSVTAKPKHKTKKQINEQKRAEQPRAPRRAAGVGAHELKDMSTFEWAAEREGAAGGRKTRAQIEAEKKAVPNAREAVQARRKGK